MSSILSAAAQMDRDLFHASEPFQTFKRLKKQITELLPQVLLMPASKLTVADILFAGEKPTPFSQFSDWESTEMQFYTQERLDRLANLWDGINR